MSGGTQTVFDAGAGAFGHAFPDLSEQAQRLHSIGDVQFGRTFVSAPATINPGLGPVFNSVSCISCHIGDGRGRPPSGNEALLGVLVRISVPGTDAHGGPAPVPGFGVQLQQRAVFGTVPEANISVVWQESTRTLADGTVVPMRSPQYQFTAPYTALPGDLLWSARVAPPVFGLGLLEAIDEASIRSGADPGDADGDGVSGRVNEVWDVVHQRLALGRFGWKAEQPSLIQQHGAAYHEDMGVTNPLFATESSMGQPQYDGRDDELELSDSLLHAVTFYVRTLAVPARRRTNDAVVQRGQAVFTASGCARCHVPQQRTRVDVSFPPVSNQRIFPYTDLLLHDMGPDLADQRPVFLADGYEWRTPPLWGIGLTQVVNGHQNFLHDGRARSLLEAVLWHGGEAQSSADAVSGLSTADREALLAFLNSL